MHGLQLVHCKLCKNVTGSTGLHCTSSRSDHTQIFFRWQKRWLWHDLTWLLQISVDSILGHASLLTLCMLKILVEYFYKHCRPRWDATVLKSRTIHIDIICFCLFDLMLYVPCQQFLSHAWMISCLPRSNQYQAADKVSYSCTHLHSESVGGKSPSSSPSIPSLTLSHLSH